jgi:signal transduction histidine kinase
VTLLPWIMAGIAFAGLVVVTWALADRMTAVARACHELRGPLTAARLGLATGGELPPGRLRAIDAELGRAALALDDLTAVRAGGPRLHSLDRVDVRMLVADSVEAWRATAEAAGAVVDVVAAAPGRQPPAVWGDRLRLAQAVGNLLANAIEHGGPRIEVRVGQRGDRVRVEVTDDGRGLPAPVAELSRRGRRARGAHGHGLGIASSIAEIHRGRLAAAPAQVGARLVLELPAAAPSGRPSSTRAVTPAPSSSPRAAR